MATEIVLEAPDRPGELARIGEILGDAEVNIQAAAAFTHGGVGMIHFVVEDVDAARQALKENGIEALQVREVMEVSLDDQPGELGRFARRLADGGVNIVGLYTAGQRAGDKQLIIAVDNVEAAQNL